MINIRPLVEDGIVTLLQPLKVAKTLKVVEAIGAADYNAMLRAVEAQPPFALIKYMGKSGTLQEGGIIRYAGEISIMIGVYSLKGPVGKRLAVFDVLHAVEEALSFKQISDAFWPLINLTEQWSQMAGGGTEVWEQRYWLQYEVTPD